MTSNDAVGGGSGGSFGLWLQPEAKSDQIDLRPQERFLNKAQNQLVNLQNKAGNMCVFAICGGTLKMTQMHTC